MSAPTPPEVAHSSRPAAPPPCRPPRAQSLSGTGSLRVGAAFIAKFMPGAAAYISRPTWGNQ